MESSESPVSRLGLGTSKLRSLIGGISERAAVRLLEATFDEGVHWFDTAPSYGQGEAETALGKLSSARRQRARICTKVGHSFGSKAALINAVKPILQPLANSLSGIRRMLQRSREHMVSHGAIRVEIDPVALRTGVTDSLRRLRRDRIEVYLLHNPSSESLREENQQTLESLRQEGLLEAWGVCTAELEIARHALLLPDLKALQVPVDPTWVHAAGDLFEQALNRGVMVMGHRVLQPLSTLGESATAAERQTMIRCRYETALNLPAMQVALCGTMKLDHLKQIVRLVRESPDIASNMVEAR